MSGEVQKVTGQSQQQLLTNPQILNSYAYTVNNPVKYTDPDGQFFGEAWSAWQGVSNAIVSNNLVGLGRVDSDNSYFNAGQTVGDIASLIQGSFEAAAGVVAAATGSVGSVVLAPTGVGAIAGTGVAVGGVLATGHGLGVASSATGNLINKSELVDNVDEIIPPSRQNHILNGNETGGGHKAGAGKGKPEFPASWSDKQIFHNAIDLATDPSKSWIQQTKEKFKVSGFRDGVNMSVIINKAKSIIISAFPKVK